MNDSQHHSIRKFLAQAIPLALLFLGMFFSFKLFEQDNKAEVRKQNESYLVECTNNLQGIIDDAVESYRDTIKSIAFLYSNLVTGSSNHSNVLGEIEKKTHFDALYFVSGETGLVYSSSGAVYADGGEVITATRHGYFNDVMAGNSGVTVLYPSRITNKREVLFYSPVTYGEEVVGALVGTIGEETVKKMIATYFYGTLTDTLLISSDLKIVGVSSRISIYDYIGDGDDPYDFNSIVKIQLTNKENEEIVFNALRGHQSTPFVYNGKLGNSLGYVKKLESIDWMIIQTFPADAIQVMVSTANHSGKILEFLLVMDFTIYIIYLICMELREKKLIQKKLAEQTKIAMLDDLTRVYNRRAFEEYVTGCKTNGTPDNLTLIEVDINGLKDANDLLGHRAGDELIKETARLLMESFSSMGSVYRLGGDEFGVFVDARKEDLEAAVQQFMGKVASWRGKLNQELSVSIGIAFANDYPDKTIDEIKTIADMLMYEDKDKYYQLTGKERRIYSLKKHHGISFLTDKKQH